MNARPFSRPLLTALAFLCIALTAGCGKKGNPSATDKTQAFSIASVSATIVNNCLAITGKMEGAFKNMERVRLETSTLTGTPDDCIGCPFVPQEVIFMDVAAIGLAKNTGEFGFSYCPQPAKGYRWRLAAISVFSTFPHSVAPEKITMKSE